MDKASATQLPGDKVAPQNTYSGSATLLYSSKIPGLVTVDGTCEILAESTVFSFAMTSAGKLYFRESEGLRSLSLDIRATATEQGITVKGHGDFLKAHSSDSTVYGFSTALNLHLSDSRLFNNAFGFPSENARVFMRPLAIKYENTDAYEFVMPCIRFYKNGIVGISLSAVAGFQNATIQEVLGGEVNKSRLNIESLLCEHDVHLAFTEAQLSQMNRRERLSQRKALQTMMKSSLSSPEEIEFVTEHLTVFELVHTDRLNLTDVARNLLALVARTIALGKVQSRIRWYADKYSDRSVGQYWCAKPVITISHHTAQLASASANWVAHKQLVNSILVRSFLPETAADVDSRAKDLRLFDDFNNFYSESVSVMLASGQVQSALEKHKSYSFDNLASDIQILNEAAQYIVTYYTYASHELEFCESAIDVGRLEIRILEFEESLLSAHKYGEVARYFEEVQRGDQLALICKLLHKKIETVRKALELDEKISSESFNRRITIIFGIIASATLSPELMQPLAKYLNAASDNESVNKIYGIVASVVTVGGLVLLTHYAFKVARWLRRLGR